MGACVSVHKESKTDTVAIPSPVKDKPIVNGDSRIADGGLKSQWSPSHPVAAVRDFGSKEETFFESQTWLESDCDDDFLSVNGDFTPSRGSTPVHHSFSAAAPRVNTALSANKTHGFKPESSPTTKKKLAELFRESLRGIEDVDGHDLSTHQTGVNGMAEEKTNSVCSSEITPNGVHGSEKEKLIESVQCCLPRMLSTRSFSERKKKTMSPARSVG